MNEVNIVPIWGINTYQNNRDLKQISSHNNKASLGIRNTFRCIKLDFLVNYNCCSSSFTVEMGMENLSNPWFSKYYLICYL